MKNVIHFLSVILLVMGLFISSCKKEENPGSGQVEFSLTMETGQSILKSASIADSTDVESATSVVITIEDANGESVKNSEKLDLYSMNGSYITQPISLLNGIYKLTQFLVLDSENNVIYASPLEGSDKAYLVEQTLPLEFNAQADVVTKLIPQVVSTAESTPENLGYTTFNFSVTETFDFLIGAFVYNDVVENYELASADISIYSNSTLVYNGKLSANTGSSQVTEYDSLEVNNKITLPESYNEYTLVVSKTGYKTYIKTFAKEELKLHYKKVDKGPLVMMLEAEQQDFYIRGYFGDEYLNFSTVQSEDQCVYYTHYTNDSIIKSLEFTAYEDATPSSRSIGLIISGRTHYSGVDSFDLDKMVVPYTFVPPTDGIINLLELVTERNCVFCQDDVINYYYGYSRGDFNLTITIVSKTNDVIVGKFFGELGNPNTGERITVRDGEFQGKIQRKTLHHN